MATLLAELQKYRFLLVVGGVLAALFVGKSTVWLAPIEFVTPNDFTAGEDSSLNLTAAANRTLLVTVEKPDHNRLNLEIETQNDGSANLVLPGKDLQIAGLYHVTATYRFNSSNTQEDFTVLPGTASLQNSQVHFSQNQLRAGQSAQMSVLLKDDYGNAISGHSLTVSPSDPSVNVFTSEFGTNEKGQMNFTVSGTANGIVSFSFFDSTEGNAVLGNPQLAFGSASGSNNPSVTLAESGPVSELQVSGLDEKTEASASQTITVTAVDENGVTVTDYTGTVRFSSSDDEAILPDNYTFRSEDQGQHRFSLSIKLLSTGNQSITVTDLEDSTIKGSDETQVLTSSDYNQEFETTDFERDGDFDLTSPAAGSQSSNQIEVQGEGEYGNTAVILVNGEEAGRADIAFDNSFDYTLEDMADGTYEIQVQIVDKNNEEVEISNTEVITVDTTAPELVAISTDPDKDLQPGSDITLTVLSEKELDSVSVVVNDEAIALEETPTPGKYEATFTLPEEADLYSVDVVLKDTLGNEAEYRDQLSLAVGTDPNGTGLTQISGLAATGAPESVSLSWEKPKSDKNIAYYRIYYGPSSDSLFAVSETTDSSTHWSIPSLTPNEAYYFSVTAVNVEGTESPQSAVVSATPKAAGSEISENPLPSTPAITGREQDVPKTPDSGPATDLLVGLSTLAAAGYVLLRKRARSHSQL